MLATVAGFCLGLIAALLARVRPEVALSRATAIAFAFALLGFLVGGLKSAPPAADEEPRIAP